MIHSSYFEEAFDDRKLFFNQWLCESNAQASIALIHGMGEHSGRYSHFAQYFTDNGINVFAVDLFGFGQTTGSRGHTPAMENYLWQVEILLEKAKAQGLPVFLYGHSMGGGIVLNYLFKNHPDIAGVIASAPAIEPAFKIPSAKWIFGKIGRIIAPSLTQRNGLDVNGISRDPKVINAYQADPLVHDFISAEVGIGVIEYGKWLTNLKIDTCPIPLLIMHGDQDPLTSFKASQDFIKKFKKSPVEFKPWHGLFHELHNEPEQKEVFNFTLNWIQQTLATPLS